MTSSDPDFKEPQKSPRDFKTFFTPATARDIVAYVLLALGIILLFFEPIYGGALVGIVIGIYFSKEIISLIRHFETIVDEYGATRSVLLAGLALAFFISAPAIFIGAILALAIQLFITNQNT